MNYVFVIVLGYELFIRMKFVEELLSKSVSLYSLCLFITLLLTILSIDILYLREKG